jgi:hypothetical protein
VDGARTSSVASEALSQGRKFRVVGKSIWRRDGAGSIGPEELLSGPTVENGERRGIDLGI